MGGKPNPGTKRDMRLSANKKAKANTSARKSATQQARVVKGK